MGEQRPAWADATVLSVCSPELHVRCDWPDCRAFARYEVSLDVDGAWSARRLCPGHRPAVGAASEP
jgi:hypothetical protein